MIPQVRDVGMASATSVLWAFNFILSFTWPALVDSFKPQGAFGWYAAWCGILWLLSKPSFLAKAVATTNNHQHSSSSQRPRSLPLKNWTLCSVSPPAGRWLVDCVSRGTGLTGTCLVAMLSCRRWWMLTSFVVSGSQRGWLGVSEVTHGSVDARPSSMTNSNSGQFYLACPELLRRSTAYNTYNL